METDGPALVESGLLFDTRKVILYTCLLAPLTYILFRFSQFFTDLRRRAKAANLLPHDPIHWLWGHQHMYPGPNEAGIAFLHNQTIKYPRCYSYWAGNNIRSLVRVHHPDTVKLILKTSEPKPLNLGTYGYALPWLGNGLLLAGGQKWARNRRLLTPAFHFDILKNYVAVKNRAVDVFLNKLEKSAEKGENFEFFGHVSLLTFDIILRCACSSENDVQTQGKNHPYIYAVTRILDLWVQRTLRPWQHSDFIYHLSSHYREFRKHCDFVHSISEQVIQQRKKFLAENTAKSESSSSGKKERYLDFLDILLTAKDSDGKGLTDLEIRDEVDTFLFEGHDTTASSISWALYSLAENMEHQILCQQEIDEILRDRDNDDITWEDLSKLKYLTLCIKESMRKNTPVPFIQRELIKELTIEGVTLPKGSVIDIRLYNLHLNPQVWDNPMEFRPSRFLPENIDKMDTFAFVPFSAGPRNCIGQNFAMHEQKIVLARILRRYTISLDPAVKIQQKLGPVMKTQNGMYMKAFPRTH